MGGVKILYHNILTHPWISTGYHKFDFLWGRSEGGAGGGVKILYPPHDLHQAIIIDCQK